MTSWLLSNLTSLTEYTVGVFALYDEGQADAVTDSFTTSTTPLLHLHIGHNVLQVSSRCPPGVLQGTGVKGRPPLGAALSGRSSEGLWLPWRAVAPPPGPTGRVCVLCPLCCFCLTWAQTCVCTEAVPEPLDFRSSEVTTDSFRVSWQQPAHDVVLYRLIWSPTDGGNPEDVGVFLQPDLLEGFAEEGVPVSALLQVLLDRNINTYVIRGLRPGSDYQVLLAATYSNEVESDEVVLLESTGRRTLDRTSLAFHQVAD